MSGDNTDWGDGFTSPSEDDTERPAKGPSRRGILALAAGGVLVGIIVIAGVTQALTGGDDTGGATGINNEPGAPVAITSRPQGGDTSQPRATRTAEPSDDGAADEDGTPEPTPATTPVPTEGAIPHDADEAPADKATVATVKDLLSKFGRTLVKVPSEDTDATRKAWVATQKDYLSPEALQVQEVISFDYVPADFKGVRIDSLGDVGGDATLLFGDDLTLPVSVVSLDGKTWTVNHVGYSNQ